MHRRVRALILIALPFLAACSEQGGRIELLAEAELGPRLSDIIAATPLPPGWKLAGPDSDAALGLELAKDVDAQAPASLLLGPRTTREAGTRWLALPLPISSPRYRFDEAEARSLGLEALESVAPPRRAAEIGGKWPGQSGYPFAQGLLLTLSGRKGRDPALLGWLDRASAACRAEAPPYILAAAGDIQLGPEGGMRLLGGEEGQDRLFGGGLLAFMRSRGLLVANLEGPVTTRGYPNPRKRFQFRFPPGSSRALGEAGLSLLLFANNHAFDYGEVGFLDSLEDLEGAGMPFVGAGRDIQAAEAPRLLPSPAGGQMLAFLGFARYPRERLGFTTEEAAAGPSKPGVASDENMSLSAISLAAAGGNTVVVMAHGGSEYVESPPATTRELYRGFADAGARLVIGSHPHVLQGIEARGQSLIAYSLGNFLFTEEAEPPQAIPSAIVSFLFYRGIPRGFLPEPIRAGIDASSLQPGEEAREALELRLSRLSAALAKGP